MGANIGVCSLEFYHRYKNAFIYAFEPQKTNYEILSMNISNYTDRIFSFKRAVAQSNLGEVKLYSSTESDNYGGYSLSAEGNSETYEMVDSVGIMDVLNYYGPMDIIKIDIEGTERLIFESIPDEALRRTKWIMGELHSMDDLDILKRLSTMFDISIFKNANFKTILFQGRNKDLCMNTN